MSDTARIATLETRVNRLENQLQAVEREMSGMTNAVERMSANLANKLSEIERASRAQLEATRSQLDAARDQLRAAQELISTSRAGFASVTDATGDVANATHSVDNSVKLVGAGVLMVHNRVGDVDNSVLRGTEAQVEMEYLRLYNEARAPVRFIESFGREIDERFAKAIEGVYVNRELYDEHFRRIHQEHDNKLRIIGEHIFEILEQDFGGAVEAHIKVPRAAYAKLALEVDERRIEARSRQLDQSLGQLERGTLTPLLEAHDAFERLLAETYQMPVQLEQAEVLVPLALALGPSGQVLQATRLVVAMEGGGKSGLNFGLEPAPGTERLTQTLAPVGQQLMRHVVPMGADTIGLLRQELRAMAQEGLLDAELLEGFDEYLMSHGLGTFDPRAEVAL